MKLKNKVLLYITGLCIFAVTLIALATWMNHKNIIEFENKIIEKNIRNLIDTISVSFEKISSTIELYQYNTINLQELITKDEYKLRDSFIRDDFTHMFLLDENMSIVKSLVYYQELNIYEEKKEFLKKHNKQIDIDKIYFTTYDYEKILFTVRKLENSFDDVKYIALGKALNSEFLSLVSRLTENYISFVPGYSMKKNENKTLIINDKTHSYSVDRVNDDVLFSYLEFHDDINGENFYLSMQSKRTIFSKIANINSYIFYFILTIFLLMIISLYYFISKYFTQRIEKMSNTIKKATKNKELNTVITVDYNDEISYLAQKLNSMFVTMDHLHFEEIKRERDFLQSILDAQESIILITDGSGIKSTNQKFTQHFNSHDYFLKNIAILENNVKENFLEIIKNYSSFDNPAKLKVSGDQDGYFVFDIKQIDIKNYVVSINDVSDINKTLLQLNEKASFDQLTKTYNKSSITCIINDWLQTKRFALVVIDIDFFKKVNDTYGHSIGDYILRDVSSLIQSNIHKKDIIGRFGGEEFILLFENRNQNDIINICERLRKTIEAHTFYYDALNVNVTISLGVALNDENSTFESIFNEADNYLYEAKRTGRNKTCYGF